MGTMIYVIWSKQWCKLIIRVSICTKYPSICYYGVSIWMYWFLSTRFSHLVCNEPGRDGAEQSTEGTAKQSDYGTDDGNGNLGEARILPSWFWNYLISSLLCKIIMVISVSVCMLVKLYQQINIHENKTLVKC